MKEHEKRIREALNQRHAGPVQMKDWDDICKPSALRALLADLDAMRADAERYRWLRDKADAPGSPDAAPMVVMTDADGSITSDPGYYLTHFALDEAIDAAMSAQAGKGGA